MMSQYQGELRVYSDPEQLARAALRHVPVPSANIHRVPTEISPIVPEGNLLWMVDEAAAAMVSRIPERWSA